MKHATLPLLAGLICLSSASIAVAGSEPSALPQAPIGFDHGIPVFELPEVVITPDSNDQRPMRVTRRSGQRPADSRSKDNTEKTGRKNRADDPKTSAHYTAMRVVER